MRVVRPCPRAACDRLPEEPHTIGETCMDDAAMMPSELDPQTSDADAPDVTEAAVEAQHADVEPDVAEAAPEAVAADEPMIAPEPEPEPGPEPGPEAQPELFPEDVPAPAEAPTESEPAAEPTLDEMVASLAGEAVADGETPAETSSDAAGETVLPETETPATPESAEEAAVADEPAADAATAAAAASEDDSAAEILAEPVPFLLQMRWRVPFWVVFGLFAAFVAALVYLLWPASAGEFVALPLYGVLVIGGASLVVIGLVTGLAVWLAARSRATDDEKAGLGRTLWARALGWTAGGVALWWVGILALDLHRAGVLG